MSLIRKEKQKAIDRFIEYAQDVESIHIKDFENLLKPFGFIPVETNKVKQTNTEAVIVNAIREAIDHLRRAGVKLSLKRISEYIGKRQTTTRDIMIKHDMYDEETKQINNPYDEWVGRIEW